MSSQGRKQTRKGRGQDKRGRSKRPDRFVKLEHWLLKTPAWRSLPPASRALYVELAQRFNGSNNGEITMSVREAARRLHIAKDTATKAFRELERKGFIRCHQRGSFHWKLRHASTWILTEHPLGDALAAKDFAHWTGEKTEPGPDQGTHRPKSRTASGRAPGNSSLGFP